MIIIKKLPTADSRTCDSSKVSKQVLKESTIAHIEDVRKILELIRKRLWAAGQMHDHTKLDNNLDELYEEFRNDFKTTKWWERHKATERHHLSLTGCVPDDVNLLDVLEYIVDGIVAGLSRSGTYKKEEIPADLLRKAFDNTIELLLSNITVEQEPMHVSRITIPRDSYNTYWYYLRKLRCGNCGLLQKNKVKIRAEYDYVNNADKTCDYCKDLCSMSVIAIDSVLRSDAKKVK